MSGMWLCGRLKQRRQVSLVALLAGLILFSVFLRADEEADETPYYFYNGKNYGSAAIFNPITVIINGGFGILQISNRSNDLSTVDFERGVKNVTYNLSHPFKVIGQYGWKNFLTREVIPTSFSVKFAQYFPNYYNHLIGGGFTYRALVDYYRYHEFPKPKLWAFTSWLAYHFLNEVVENSRYTGPSVDPIADFYLFNTAGLIMFSFDKVANFFSSKLNMSDWSFMPALNPWGPTIENNGQSYMVRMDLPFVENWGLMYHWGVHGLYGLSYQRPDGNSYTLGAGLVVKDLVRNENASGVRELTTTLVWTAGAFWDRNNSLLASLILSGTKGYKARLNIYPGVVKWRKLSPGFSVNLRNDNILVFGLHISWLPFGVARRIR